MSLQNFIEVFSNRPDLAGRRVECVCRGLGSNVRGRQLPEVRGVRYLMNTVIEATDRYHPIHLDSLVLDSILDFNLYTRTTETQYVLFRASSTQFTHRHRHRLLQNGTQTLYVSERDQATYAKYVEQNIGSLVQDPAVPNEQKAQLLYSVCKGVLLDALDNPRSSDLVQRTEQIMPHTVSYILRGIDALQDLISIMSYDYYTFTHSINVSVFCVALAHEVGVNDTRELNDLATGALLHDIGKNEIPKSILNKKGALNVEEMEVMKTHVQIGEKILSSNSNMNATRLLPVSQHHERVNGEGYPRRLRYEQIHVYGLIAGIADCFDAMTTNRVYHPALRAFEALDIMKHKLGHTFDPRLLDAFIRMLRKVK